MGRATDLGSLTPAEWDRLQDYLDRFESAWQQAPPPAGSVDLTAFLPPAGDSLRLLTLHELIKSELEIRWRHGRPVRLEYYLEWLPELGGARNLPAGLLYEEYRVRQRYGDKPPLALYHARFPQQFAELQQLVQREPVVPPPAVPPAPAVAPPAPAPVAAPDNRNILRVGSGYRLSERLSAGAFGEVWRAEAPGGIEVALKIITGSIDHKEAQRELQAMELIKRLHHPFLLAIHAYWQQEDRLVIAMELADGSLRDRENACRKAGQPGMPREELLAYAREAAEAVDFLHARNVLHRDLKPENILLVAEHAKVADFGLARVVEQSRRLISASDCGTPAYTAPEVFWRGKVGAGSDLYSLAVIYAELRLHRPLFPTHNWYQLMTAHLQRLPDLAPLPEAEQQVLRRALAKEPDDRFRSCREFVRALEQVAAS